MIKQLLLTMLFCLMTTRCYSTVITVGNATVRNTSAGGYTFLNRDLAANDTGTIDHLEIGLAATGTYIDFAVFTTNYNPFTSAGSALGVTPQGAGTNSFNAPGDFTAFAVVAGQIIGAYANGGPKYDLYASVHLAYTGSDAIPMIGQNLTYYDGQPQIYGSGVTPLVGYISQVIFINE